MSKTERAQSVSELVFRALGDGHRLQILDLLMQREMNAGELLGKVDVVQSTLSHHMKTLCESGLVNARKNGKWTIYRVNEEAVRDAREFLCRFLSENADVKPDADGKSAQRLAEETAGKREEPPADLREPEEAESVWPEEEKAAEEPARPVKQPKEERPAKEKDKSAAKEKNKDKTKDKSKAKDKTKDRVRDKERDKEKAKKKKNKR